MRDDLVKNSKGKIVSRRKSKQAGEQNNLGVWLRTKGDKFGDKPGKQAVLKDKPVAPKGSGRSSIPRAQRSSPKPKPKPLPIVRVLKDKPKPRQPEPEPKVYGAKKIAKNSTNISVQRILANPRRESRTVRRERELREKTAARKKEREARWRALGLS